MNKKAYWLLVPLALLLALGSFNVYRKAAWKEPTDGVVWETRPEGGLVAIKVDENGPGDFASIKPDDVLYAVDNIRINTKIDLAKALWAATTSGPIAQKVTYQINRGIDNIAPKLMPGQKGISLTYIYLAIIAVMTLVIMIIVFFNSAKPFALPNIYFYILSAVLYAFYIFSPTGQLDLIDSVFYWLDRVAFLVFPPLLLHFFLVFPQRKKFLRTRMSIIYLLYLPAAALILADALFHLPYFNNLDNALLLRVFETLEKLNLLHFALYSFLTLATISDSYFRHPGFLVRKQLKWIVTGLGAGILPFTLLYVIPFLAGRAPSKVAELTILLQAFVPLAFSYSISRTRLMDLEVIIKKAGTLIFSYFVLAVLYLGVSSQTKLLPKNNLNVYILGLLALILGGTFFSPLKRLFQSLFDKVFYRRSYEYRKTLLSISQELSRERNLENLARSLLELIANALNLPRIALLLPFENEPRTFIVFSARGETAALGTHLAFPSVLYDELAKEHALSLYSWADTADLRGAIESLRSSGFEHILALRVEGHIIGSLAMGRKADATYLTSEDWELLTTISSPVALALENATLYNQASLRAQELERLKDYSENIIESLTVGVAVLDQNGRVIGWNRVLEDLFLRKKKDILGDSLIHVLGADNFGVIFPTDTQDFHLLSEIPMDVPAGGKRIFDIAKTPLLDNLLTPYGTIIVFEDVTDKVNLQQQLLTSEKLASIGLLSAGVAHEINTPLTGISSYVQMLQKRVSDVHFSQILEKIEFQTERVSRIIKNLLNFARNPSDLAFHRVDIKDSLQEIISLIEYKLKAMNIQLDLALGPVKPIWAQGERLQQVFINIILNAMDAMPQGGTLRIELTESAAEATIRITDTGSGIKEQHLAHIFDPFFTTKGVGKGTGLGLSISYAIIKEHEGRVTVESQEGRGTAFTIVVPKDLDRRKREAAKAEKALP
jgi:two-component system NtrC family sensor kinase